LIDEVKYIIYCLAYFAGGGRLGRLSAKTLEQRWVVLRSAVLFVMSKSKAFSWCVVLATTFQYPGLFGSLLLRGRSHIFRKCYQLCLPI
jgi:hypothetical protein